MTINESSRCSSVNVFFLRRIKDLFLLRGYCAVDKKKEHIGDLLTLKSPFQ